jgi:hypothetical protein
MIEVPIHIKKLVKDYASGKIKNTDIKLTADEGKDVTKDLYEISLPTYNVLGDPVGTHDFALTLESLVATKAKIVADLNAYIAQVDSFVADYDSLIAVLQDVKNKTKP